MKNILDETIESLTKDYEKVKNEYDVLAHKLNEIVAKHTALTELKNKITDESTQKTGETIIVNKKAK